MSCAKNMVRWLSEKAKDHWARPGPRCGGQQRLQHHSLCGFRNDPGPLGGCFHRPAPIMICGRAVLFVYRFFLFINGSLGGPASAGMQVGWV